MAETKQLRILFMGRKLSGAESLEWTVAQGHHVVGVLTDNHLPGSPTTAIAQKLRLPVFGLNEANARIATGELSFDLAVSFVYWRKIAEPLLSHPRFGVINFHPAPLPAYKGTAGYNLAILEGLSEWAVTAHYMDAGIDTGAIIEVSSFPIDRENETVVSLERTSQEKLKTLYRRTVSRVAENGLLPTSPNLGGRYISRDEMEAMKEIKPGDDIDRKIRAFWFPPYPGAYLPINGKKYTLVNEKILALLAPAGQTFLINRPAGQ